MSRLSHTLENARSGVGADVAAERSLYEAQDVRMLASYAPCTQGLHACVETKGGCILPLECVCPQT